MAGEIQRLRPSRRGHLYCELIEKGPGDEIVGKLEAVCWRRDYQRVRHALAAAGQTLDEGQEIRCRANLDFYPPFGRLQLVVREIDPVFTLGQLARRRRETLSHLAAAGLLEANRGCPLSELPLRIALITSEGSAAFHDFLATLEESPYGFRVILLGAAVQGRAAERELAAALASLPAVAADCAVVIRGGGARTDLAAFDSRPVAEGIARAPIPVLTGLGHQIDETIADRVAHTALKTPTKVAEFLVERMRRSDERLAALDAAFRGAATRPLQVAAARAERAERALIAAAFRLRSAGARISELAVRLRAGASRTLARRRRRAGELGRRIARVAPRWLRAAGRRRRSRAERLAAAARSRLRQMETRLEGNHRLCRQLGVERTLARGFTITRDTAGGVIRSALAVRGGERIETVWVDGSRRSRVEES